MKKKFKIAITREHVSTSLDIVKAVIDLMIDDDVPAADAVARVVAEKALEKYQGHIRAAFARVGIVLADGEVINVDVLLRVINEKSGLEIDTLSAAGVSSLQGRAAGGAFAWQPRPLRSASNAEHEPADSADGEDDGDDPQDASRHGPHAGEPSVGLDKRKLDFHRRR